MVQANWSRLKSVNSEELSEDEATELCAHISEIDINAEDDVENLKLLFKVTRIVMQTKAVQAEVAMEELETVVSKSGETTSSNDLLKQIDSLNKEIQKLKRDNSARNLENEKSPPKGISDLNAQELDRANKKLLTDLKDKERQLAIERKENERISSRVEDVEKDRRELLQEINQLKDENEEYRKQLSVQMESFEKTTDTSKEHAEKVRDKNKQINQLLEDITQLEQYNTQLEKQVGELRDKLRDSTEQIEKTTTDYANLKESLANTDVLVEELRHEKAVLTIRVENLIENQNASSVTDEEILATVSKEVEIWKTVLADKEFTIANLREQIVKLQNAERNFESTMDRTSVVVLGKAIEERNVQLGILRGKLEEATKELEESANTIEMLRNSQVEDADEDQTRALHHKVKELELSQVELKARCREAEDHALSKDQEALAVLAQLKKYESGEYGLAEAVAEIKAAKNQVRIRDKQIEELTQVVNKFEIVATELEEENLAFRERLGLDLDDVKVLREQSKAKGERERAINLVLRKDVEKLEDERIALKQEIRKLTQIIGFRSSTSGILTEDEGQAQNLSTSFKDGGSEPVKNISVNELNEQLKLMETDLICVNERLAIAMDQNARYQLKLRSVETETDSLRKPVDDDGEKSSATLNVKAEQLQIELKSIKQESVKANAQLNKILLQMEKIQFESGVVKQSELEVTGNLNVSDSHEVANMNSLLVNTLEELDVRTNNQKNLEETVQSYKRKFAAFKHQIGLLYKDHQKLKDDWSLEKKSLLETIDNFKATKEIGATYAEAYEHLQKILQSGDDEIKKNLSEMSRSITILQVNEKTLLRKYTSLKEVEGHLRRENSRLYNEISSVENAFVERLGYLQRNKEVTAFQLAALQSEVGNSVPTWDFEVLQRDHEQLMARHEEVVEQNSKLAQSVKSGISLERMVVSLEREKELFRMELAAAKEKLRLAQSIAKLDDGNVGSSANDVNLEKQVKLLEMSVLNERQRAEHVNFLNEQNVVKIKELEERNNELEAKFAELTRMNLQQQKTEMNLKGSLAGSVGKEEFVKVKEELAELRKSESDSKAELSKLKEVAEISHNQACAVECRRVVNDKEVAMLRNQMIELQSASDEKTLIGKLYRQMVGLQVSEASTRHQLEKCRTRLRKVEVMSLRLEQRCDEKDYALQRLHKTSRTKIQVLQKGFSALRKHYSEAIASQNKENLIRDSLKFHEDKMKAKKELEELTEKRESVKMSLLETEAKKTSFDELIAAVKSNLVAEKLMAWHEKMYTLRLAEMKAAHRIDLLKSELEKEQKVVESQEEMIRNLATKLVNMENYSEELQLVFDTELNRPVSQILNMDYRVHTPDPSLPVDDQMKHLVTAVGQLTTNLEEKIIECRKIKQELEDETRNRKELESQVLARDNVIGELRLKIPTSIAMSQVSEQFMDIIPTSDVADSRHGTGLGNALNISQAIVRSLQERLAHKEETIVKLQALLQQARNEFCKQRGKNRQEMVNLQSRLQNESDNWLTKYRAEVQQTVTDAEKGVVEAQSQLLRIRELEDVAAQQDALLVTYSQDLKAAKMEIQLLRSQRREFEADGQREEIKVEETREAVTERMKDEELDALKKESSEKDTTLQVCRREMEELKEALKQTPSAMMKNLVERLKSQLVHKDKQIHALGKTLTELKADIIQASLEGVNAKVGENFTESDVQALARQQTKGLQDKNDVLRKENSRLKMETQEKSEMIITLQKDMEELKLNAGKRETSMLQLRNAKRSLEMTVRKLEGEIKKLTEKPEKDIAMSEPKRSQQELNRTWKLTSDGKQIFSKTENEINVTELKLKNEFLQKKVEELEKLCANNLESPTRKSAALSESIKRLQDENGDLQNRLLKHSKEKLELELERENSKKSDKMLRDEISALKHRLEPALEIKDKSAMEFEKTINVMKRAIVRLQRDKFQNEKRLVENQQMIENFKLEEDKLKKELGRLREKGDAFKMQDVFEKSVLRLTKENDRLSAKVEQEAERNEELGGQVTRLKCKLDSCHRQLEEKRAAKHFNETVGSEIWKMQALVRTYEEKLVSLDEHLRRNSNLQFKLKSLLREAALLEQDWINQIAAAGGTVPKEKQLNIRLKLRQILEDGC